MLTHDIHADDAQEYPHILDVLMDFIGNFSQYPSSVVSQGTGARDGSPKFTKREIEYIYDGFMKEMKFEVDPLDYNKVKNVTDINIKNDIIKWLYNGELAPDLDMSLKDKDELERAIAMSMEPDNMGNA